MISPTPFRDISFAICSRPEARRELNFAASTWTHYVSIGDPGAQIAVNPRRMGARLLRLELDDVTPDENRSPEMIRARWGYIAATSANVQAIMDFGRTLPSKAQVLIHCEQGISRSTAAATILLMERFPDLNRPDALALVRRARPQARPNPWMLGLYALLRNS